MAEQTIWQRVPGLRATHGYTAVPCETCRAEQGEPCLKGGDSWPERARRPHADRRRAALLVAWWEEFGRFTPPATPHADDRNEES